LVFESNREIAQDKRGIELFLRTQVLRAQKFHDWLRVPSWVQNLYSVDSRANSRDIFKVGLSEIFFLKDNRLLNLHLLPLSLQKFQPLAHE
jgi:hypothetical protein